MSAREQAWKRRAEALLGVAASAILFAMMLLTTVDVVARYVFNRPLRGAFEVTELLLVVLIFAGLTAWDTQKIKEMYDPQEDGTAVGRKAVMGALTLYLDFINLFLFLLRLLGDRR